MEKQCSNPKCLAPFETKDSRKQYCTRSCAAVVNNTLYPKRVSANSGKACEECSGPLKVHQKTFCSKECAGKYKRDLAYANWINGSYSGEDANGHLSNGIRRRLIENANGRCTSPTCCVPGGWGVPNPITGKPILTVDHIDGNWRNNTVDNLIVLCYNCHTLTETFGALNTGSASGTRPNGLSRKR